MSYWSMIYDYAEQVIYGLSQSEINETTYYDVVEMLTLNGINTEYADDVYRTIINEWKK